MEIEEMDDMDRQVEAIFEDMAAILNEMVADLNKTINRIEEIHSRMKKRSTQLAETKGVK